MSKEGQVKIADFGLAKLMGREAKDFTLTGAGQVMGTPNYMAPEQIEHPQDVDHRADIYSLGVVFYQMLTGELPLGRFAPPSRKVQIDVRLDEVVLRALEKEPEQRYQQASELKTQVESVVTSPPRRCSKCSSRRSQIPVNRRTLGVGGYRRHAFRNHLDVSRGPLGCERLCRGLSRFSLRWAISRPTCTGASVSPGCLVSSV